MFLGDSGPALVAPATVPGDGPPLLAPAAAVAPANAPAATPACLDPKALVYSAPSASPASVWGQHFGPSADEFVDPVPAFTRPDHWR